jgi:hypothetical protein
MAADKFLQASDVLAFLDKRSARARPAEEEELRSQYRKAAAVLAALRNPDGLRPIGGSGKLGEGVRLLTSELVTTTGRKFEGAVMLRSEVRRAAIRELQGREARLNALRANPAERTGAVQQALELYLVGDPKPIGEESASDLDSILQVSVWLEGVVDSLPPAEELRRRIAYRNLIEPFEAIAGDGLFQGRVREMDDLRSYVGVLPPESLIKRLSDQAFRWLKPDALPALSISGPGGVGKSSLVARFILEHSRLPERVRVPFAYIDFDRPILSISEPATLLAEMLLQLDLQFPQFKEYRELREFLLRGMGYDLASKDAPPGTEQYIQRVRSVMADLLGTMENHLGPRPYIVVLDTFEEVQYRGESRAFPVWELLNDMQVRWPFLRVVVCGRGPVSTLQMAGAATKQLEIGELDQNAAIRFLALQGVPDRSLAENIVKQVGAVPLSLKLAASVLAREEGNEKGLRDFSGKSQFWFSPSDEVIQGQLYERVLGHIHDPKIERLAHPGLVLRRISPDIILNVLNKPCRLDVDSLAEAQVLFEGLRKETTLVASDSLDGSLVHRPDLRRIMLKLLGQKCPAQVEESRSGAVRWYSVQEGWRAKAEELYHRLQLLESIEAYELDNPEIRSSLQASIVELPATAQTQLASYGFQVSKEILEQATLEQREGYQVARVEELLPYGKSSVTRARQIVEAQVVTSHSGRMFRSAARVAAQQEMYSEALQWIAQGMHWAGIAGDTLQILELTSEKAWLLRHMENWHELSQTLPLLLEYAQRHADRRALFLHAVQTYEVLQQQVDTQGSDRLLEKISALFIALNPKELWDIFPVLENVLQPLSNRKDTLPALNVLVLTESTPFKRAEFSDRRAQAALERLLKRITSFVLDGTDLKVKAIAKAAIELCETWPYRVLYVQPPYGNTGFDNYESSIASA